MITWYTRVLCHHPYVVLSSVVVVIGICLGLSLLAKPLPDFNDPALGFESRGTAISQRITAWENLMESTNPRGPLQVKPIEKIHFHDKKIQVPTNHKPVKHEHKVCVEMTDHGVVEIANNCTELDNRTRNDNYSFVVFDEIRKITMQERPERKQEFSPDYHWEDFDDDYDEHFDHDHTHMGNDKFFCGELLPGYGHVVVQSNIYGDNLFTLQNLLSICKLDSLLRTPEMLPICENISNDKCCPSWSLPNFIAMLANKTSCFDINATDVNNARRDLRHCARHLDLELEGGCGSSSCRNIPEKCLENKIFYTILHFLTDADFLQPQVGRKRRPINSISGKKILKSPHSPHSPQKTVEYIAKNSRSQVKPAHVLPPSRIMSGPHASVIARNNRQRHHLQHLGSRQTENRLKYTAIFLPVPRSEPTLPFFEAIEKTDLSYMNISVEAMDLGLKNAVFNKLLMSDSYLLCVGGGFVVFLIWFFTGSLFITIVTIITVACSLLVAYFLYVFVYHITFFPYMNVLTAVIAIGLGADDTFIYCRVWSLIKAEMNDVTMLNLVSETMRHAAASILVTSLTTASAFLASYTSHITAIKCFSIFAGTVVLANFILMMTWIPACVVVAENWGASTCCLCVPPSPIYASTMNPKCSKLCTYPLKLCYWLSERGRLLFEKIFPPLIIQLRVLWILVLGGLAIAAAIVVFYSPGLRLPDTQEFQLFDRHHPFEKYDLFYKYEFWFERNLRRDIVNRLPIRIVWGIKPIDNGDYLDPSSKGTLEFDETFDMSDPQSQVWLLQFCRNLRNQTFYMLTLGPLLPNCFIETFKITMERRCIDPQNGFDRSPCCESSTFPYSREVFDQCIEQTITQLYETPREFFIPGVAGPKFSKKDGKIRAVVVEYDSTYIWSFSYDEMDEFFQKVETWVTDQMRTAPIGMKNGWFTSYLSFYDVQRSLSIGTGTAVAVAVVVCLIVLLFTTLNLIVSLLAILSVAAVMVVTLASLVLLGWRLNVLESVTVSVAIGLAVDLTLHYGVAYRLAPEQTRDAAVKWAIGRLGGPVLMAALTSICAGAAMIPARVLAYVHVGTFLTILTAVSYLYATLFYLSLLRTFGPESGFCQFSYKKSKLCSNANRTNGSDKHAYQQTFIHSESTLSTSSNCPNMSVVTNMSDTHELEPLTNRGSVRSSSKKRHSTVSRVSSGSHSATDEVRNSQASLHYPQHNGGPPSILNSTAAVNVLADVPNSKRRSGSLSSSLSIKERRERALRKISLPSPNDGQESCEMAEPSPKLITPSVMSATTVLSEGEPMHQQLHKVNSPSYNNSPTFTAPRSPYFQHIHGQVVSPKRKSSCSSPLSLVPNDNIFTT